MRRRRVAEEFYLIPKGVKMYDLIGKVALVTGAGGEKGIGRAIAVRLAREGAEVAVVDLALSQASATGWGGLSAVAREIEAMGRRAIAIAADISYADTVDAMVAQVLEAMGHIDILVNNAGSTVGRDRVAVVELEEAEWDRVFRVNAKGTFLCCRAVARAMIARGAGGRIINISSLGGKKVGPNVAAYCASKFAVRGLTQVLAWELGCHSITVNAICPGLVVTERANDLVRVATPEGSTPEEWREQYIGGWTATTAVGRTTTVSDVANMAAFLASSESDNVTGQSLIVAGGALMD